MGKGSNKRLHDGKRMSLTGHLDELRSGLIIVLIAIGIGFMISFYFSELLLKVFTGFIKSEPRPSFVFLSPGEALWTNFKVALFAGIILALPIILYQFWRFISPGLHGNERRYAFPFLLVGIIFFGLGLFFCYMVVLRFTLDFLLTYKTADLSPMLSIGAYLDFVIKFMLAFGLIFELPIVIVFLTRIGVLTPEFLSKNRKYAILLSFVAAAILTPTPDVFNQSLMAGPLIALYEVGIIGAKIFRRRTESENEKIGAA